LLKSDVSVKLVYTKSSLKPKIKEMSDNLTVRLEFKGFLDKDLSDSLFTLKTSQTKDVKSLEQLIQKQFDIKESVCLNVDDLALEQTEPIDLLRDNVLIV